MPLAPEAFAYVKELLRRESAMELDPSKDYLVESRLVPLARKSGENDLNKYLTKVSQTNSPKDRSQIVEAMTVNETSFFRDNMPFKALQKDILPALLKQRPGPRLIRLWSAASSSGQEIYSMMMAAQECPEVANCKLEYVASDLSQDMVNRVIAGKYSKLELNRGLTNTQLAKHFTQEGGQWVVNKDFRRAVSAQVVNLNRPFPNIGKFDVVFLRNVLIYFSIQTREDILRRMFTVMNPGAYLLVGSTESLNGSRHQFKEVEFGRVMTYQKPM